MKRTCAREGALVSEADRNGQITLSVDQEVFIETVEQDHTVDDANVATEVTSFERVGDAYVLEGAIVFAGYLTKATSGSGAGHDSAANPYARHVHHRMPFTLRVPVQFQPRGVVNVASRISDWKLDVMSDGWLRVQAKLWVSGLNGKHGYHFQCGAQEVGDILFGNSFTDSDTTDVAEVPVDKSATPSAPSVDSVQDDAASRPEQLAENGLEMVRAQTDEKWAGDEEQGARSHVESVSEARGGVDESLEEAENNRESSAKREDPGQMDSERPSAREELRTLDRYVQTDEAKVSDEPKSSGKEEVLSSSTESSADESPETSEFEFEHQVDLSKVPVRATNSNVDGNVSEPSVKGPVEESFVASRSFSEDGFQATAGFIPTVNVGIQTGDTANTVVDADEREEESAVMRTVDTSLWSFVDFNAPDNYYTLRYVIAMEEESLSSLAERVGCSEGDLMRTNRMTGDSIIAGQVLKVPGELRKSS